VDFRKIKLCCVDVDGTLTDSKLFIDLSGNAIKGFNRRDFFAMSLLRSNGIKVATINTPLDGCDEYLHKWNVVDYSLKGTDKRGTVERHASAQNLDWSEIAYIGDFEDDMACLCLAGWSGCPADAIKEVKSVCHFVSQIKGGDGVLYGFVKSILSIN